MTKEEVEALDKLAGIWDGKSFDPMSTAVYKRCAEELRVTLAKLRQPSAEVDEAREREMFRKHYGVIDNTNALPMYETMVQIWIDSARARSGKG